MYHKVARAREASAMGRSVLEACDGQFMDLNIKLTMLGKYAFFGHCNFYSAWQLYKIYDIL